MLLHSFPNPAVPVAGNQPGQVKFNRTAGQQRQLVDHVRTPGISDAYNRHQDPSQRIQDLAGGAEGPSGTAVRSARADMDEHETLRGIWPVDEDGIARLREEMDTLCSDRRKVLLRVRDRLTRPNGEVSPISSHPPDHPQDEPGMALRPHQQSGPLFMLQKDEEPRKWDHRRFVGALKDGTRLRLRGRFQRNRRATGTQSNNGSDSDCCPCPARQKDPAGLHQNVRRPISRAAF